MTSSKMLTNYLLILLVVLFAWSSRDKIPVEYQFWRHNESFVKVVNNSDQDLTEVKVLVWSEPHKIGPMKKGKTYELKMNRPRDVSDVVISFKYGNEVIERFAGTIDEEDEYKMTINVNFAGVITVQEGGAAPVSE